MAGNPSSTTTERPKKVALVNLPRIIEKQQAEWGDLSHEEAVRQARERARLAEEAEAAKKAEAAK